MLRKFPVYIRVSVCSTTIIVCYFLFFVSLHNNLEFYIVQSFDAKRRKSLSLSEKLLVLFLTSSYKNLSVSGNMLFGTGLFPNRLRYVSYMVNYSHCIQEISSEFIPHDTVYQQSDTNVVGDLHCQWRFCKSYRDYNFNAHFRYLLKT